MILPAMTGSAPAVPFAIYTACDTAYFDEFAPNLIRSIQANSPDHLHLHIFNPRPDQLAWCAAQSGVSVSYEHVAADQFNAAAAKWTSPGLDALARSQLERTRNAMKKGQDRDLHHRMQKTYYACARFIRLAELGFEGTVMSMDVDAVVRSHIPRLGTEHDFYLHKITGAKARILAGGMYLNPQGRSVKFLNQYAQLLRMSLEQDYIYWGLDQDILDQIVPGYASGNLPISMIDWDMRPDSCIWTAKGTRKDLPKFIAEQQRYSV
jgi:hypothetical protein